MPMPGPLELVVILVIALLILGPGKLPDVGAALGKSIREFRKAASDVQEAARVDPSPQPPPAPPAPITPASQPPADATPTAGPAAPTADSASSEPKP